MASKKCSKFRAQIGPLNIPRLLLSSFIISFFYSLSLVALPEQLCNSVCLLVLQEDSSDNKLCLGRFLVSVASQRFTLVGLNCGFLRKATPVHHMCTRKDYGAAAILAIS